MFTKALFTIVFAVFASVHAAPSAKFCNGAIYSVKSGDTCDSIAQMFGVTAAALIAENPGINAACTNLVPSESLCIPI